MHWGWTAGYNFLVIEGMADADNDGTVDTPFQFHAVGDDNYLTSISNIETTGITSNMTIEIDVEVNIADWLRGVNLATAGISHGVSGINEQIIANTNINRVFNVATTGIDQFDQLENSVTFDYTLPYAPTIYYKFPSSHAVSVEIVDLAGKQVLQQKNLNHEGNFFINKELSYGTYIARLTSDTNESLTKKFIVRQ